MSESKSETCGTCGQPERVRLFPNTPEYDHLAGMGHAYAPTPYVQKDRDGLKACPFCGSSASVDAVSEPEGGTHISQCPRASTRTVPKLEETATDLVCAWVCGTLHYHDAHNFAALTKVTLAIVQRHFASVTPPNVAEPVAMILSCPSCAARHIDEGEFATKVHHTHACQGCGMVWRPAIGPTVGVQFLPGFKNGTRASVTPQPERSIDGVQELEQLAEFGPCQTCGWHRGHSGHATAYRGFGPWETFPWKGHEFVRSYYKAQPERSSVDGRGEDARARAHAVLDRYINERNPDEVNSLWDELETIAAQASCNAADATSDPKGATPKTGDVSAEKPVETCGIVYMEQGGFDSACAEPMPCVRHQNRCRVVATFEIFPRQMHTGPCGHTLPCPDHPADPVPQPSAETILGPAILDKYGVACWQPIPGSHYSVSRMFPVGEQPLKDPQRQGFMTSNSRFVGRAEGMRIALAAGQVKHGATYSLNDLFSEDLWEKREHTTPATAPDKAPVMDVEKVARVIWSALAYSGEIVMASGGDASRAITIIAEELRKSVKEEK